MAVDLVVSIGSKIAEYLIQPIGRQFGYVVYYKSNLESLKNEVRKLEEKSGAVQLSVDEANRKGEVIGPDVRGWLDRVAEPSKVAQSILEAGNTEANKKCMDGSWCPNLKSRYSLSRKAKKVVEKVAELLQEWGNLTRVSYPAPPPEIVPTQGIRDFESRRLIAEEVMEALKEDRVNIIGICGMGGVGKTTMVMEVAKKAKEQNLFDTVVIAVVSKTPEVKKIQDDIADLLGFKFEQASQSGRARALHERLKRIERILVVLDDVWKEIDLNEIGIPFGDAHEHCKILLTSRSKDVCNDMKTQRNIQVGVLHDEEAWNLFKEMAGISIDTTSCDLQMKVAKECGGLPLAIVTVGKALKDKPEPSWNSALKQLSKSILENIRDVEEKVFKTLKLSYDFIDGEEAKKCFLLFSLYPEDSLIPIEDLFRFGFGLGLYKDIDSVDEARMNFLSYIDNFIKCYLLMDSEKDGFVKMHDVIRDVSISIASREENLFMNPFMVRCDEALQEWPEHDRRKNYAVISMRFSEMRGGIPDNLEFPKLQLLRLDFDRLLFLYRLLIEAPESWFQGMKQLKAVALSRMYIRSLPTSLRCLTNLQTLSLCDCELIDQDFSAIGTLENLEILSFDGSNIMELPREIGNLTRLKLLDLLNCRVHRIPYGVLSSLSKLEELYLGQSFTDWDVVARGKGISTNACVAELAFLPNLVALTIYVPERKLWVWPKDVAVLQKVKTFDLYLGGGIQSDDINNSYHLSNRLVLHGISGAKEGGFKRLFKRARYLDLHFVKGVGKMLCDLDDEGGFEHLTELTLWYCSGLEGLIDTTDGRLAKEAFSALKKLQLINMYELTHLWKGPTHPPHFRNLTRVEISECDKLESVFSLSEVRNLVQLEDLSIWGARTLTEVIVSDGDEIVPATEDRIEFPKLTNLWLNELRNFTAFSRAMNPIELPRLELLSLRKIPKLDCIYPASEGNYDTNQPLFNNKGALSRIETLLISEMDNLIQIWPGDLQANLRTILLCGCHNLLNILLPSNLIKCMQNLENLEVKECESLEVAFDIGGLNVGERQGAIALPCLAMLRLNDLRNLTQVWANYSPGIQGFQNLRSLTVIKCNSLRILFSPSVAKLLVMLKELEIAGCEVMEAVIAWEQEVDVEVTTNTIVFPQLTSVTLSHLPNLTSFYPQAYTVEGSFLQKVKVIVCPKMMALPLAFQRVIDKAMESSCGSEAIESNGGSEEAMESNGGSEEANQNTHFTIPA